VAPLVSGRMVQLEEVQDEPAREPLRVMLTWQNKLRNSWQ
jgi:hypothetical protein